MSFFLSQGPHSIFCILWFKKRNERPGPSLPEIHPELVDEFLVQEKNKDALHPSLLTPLSHAGE